MGKIICMGELIVDMISLQKGVILREATEFRRCFGGAPGNVAMNLSSLGSKALFFGCVGKDHFGDYLISQLERNSVDTTHIRRTDLAHTTLAFISLDMHRQPSFLFYRRPGADMLLSTENIDESEISEAEFLHVGTLSLSSEPFRSAQFRVLDVARSSGVPISCDVNIREGVWGSAQEAKQYGLKMIEYANVLQANRAELKFLTGTEDPRRGTAILGEDPSKLILVTLREKGCFFRRGAETGMLPSFSTDFENGVGTGDAFAAGTLHYLSRALRSCSLEDLPSSDLIIILHKACAVGALAAASLGALPASLSEREVDEVLAKVHPKAQQLPTKLVLFDIDGTLVGNLEIGKIALLAAINSATGANIRQNQHSFDGNTDLYNASALLAMAGLPEGEISKVLPKILEDYVSTVREQVTQLERNLQLLPGVRDLLEYLSNRDDILVGLLTGNLEQIAEIKLEAADLVKYFAFGVFGSERADRNRLPELALRRAKEEFGLEFAPSDVVIVGDTVRDIQCAKNIGARSIALATGPANEKELRSEEPDAFLQDLGDIVKFLDAMDGTDLEDEP